MTPLILAIQPDRSKASQLRSIASRVKAELRLVDSVGSALEAIRERVPDLILTPPLLSARDDSALTGRLRELGDAAAHIQTLTIPALQETPAPLSGAGMFATLRRDKPRAFGPEACEADTFAEQVAVYLKGAAETRRKHSPAAVPDEAPTPLAHDESPVPAAARESPTADGPRRSPPPNLAQLPSLEDFDLSSFISEDLLEPVPMPSVGEPSNVRDLSAFLSQFDAPPEQKAPNVLPDELANFLPEAPRGAGSKEPRASEGLTDFVSEDPAASVSEKVPNYDNWHFFDPGQTRFAELLVKLDEIAARPA